MSTIYFHSPEGTAKVRGAERHHMAKYILDIFASILEIPEYFDPKSAFFDLIPKNCYLYEYIKTLTPDNWDRFIGFLHTWIRVNDKSYFVIGDYRIELFGSQLNTAILVGSDQVKLMTRLHGQCEIHCYVEAENRLWLANIIESGLKKGIYRKSLDWGELGLEDLGWDSVISLLRNGRKSPVVTSYSVCDTFPNPHVANFKPSEEEDSYEKWEKWYDLSEDKQWELAIAGLRGKIGMELTPDNWDDYYFSHGWDAFKINRLLTIPVGKWGSIARVFDQTQLRATEAWEHAINAV